MKQNYTAYNNSSFKLAYILLSQKTIAILYSAKSMVQTMHPAQYSRVTAHAQCGKLIPL